VTPALGGNWRKSSYSGGTGGDCVEVSWDEQGPLTRDSKAPNSGTLQFAGEAWATWLSAVKAGRFAG
jgi:uncharacterized protein DUF397